MGASIWHNEEAVFSEIPSELIVFRRYIDDIFILWKGEGHRLALFLENFNKNDRNIKLTWDISEKTITFLDLEIIQENQVITKKTHFKNVDRNSY